ncbi:MAG TPA: DUF4124 domain-containing protein [Burkholderiales bacterium]
MLRLALLLVFLPSVAQADLYRWIDPDSGSVKLSSQPPADPRVSAEVVPFRAPPPPPKTAAGAAAKPAATTPQAAETVSVQALEMRWRELLGQLADARPEDIVRNAAPAEAYEAARTELDRLDPNGAARRQAIATRALARLREGLAAQGAAPQPTGKK